MSAAERTRRQARLLSQIQQQRLDLSATTRQWLQATAPYDRGWNTLLGLRRYALIASSILAIRAVRHPSFLLRWAKRGVGAWSAWRLIRNTLPQQPR